MRINKYIASAGVTSRRKADELIAAGRVTVNGVVMTAPGLDVADGDVVCVDGSPVQPKTKKVYYMMYKPAGCITSVSDESGRRTVMDVLGDVGTRVYPVGRLDYNTEGLLFLTNDGDFAYALTHPKKNIPKHYRARVTGTLTQAAAAQLRRGVDIGGYVTKRARVDIVTWNGHSTIVDLEIHEGKNRQVRRMFEAVGFEVTELTRLSVGNVSLGRLKPGQFRKLTPEEVAYFLKLSQRGNGSMQDSGRAEKGPGRAVKGPGRRGKDPVSGARAARREPAAGGAKTHSRRSAVRPDGKERP